MIVTLSMSNEDLALLHGCVIHEIERMVEQRATMQDGAMLAQTFTYTLKLERLRDSLKLALENT